MEKFGEKGLEKEDAVEGTRTERGQGQEEGRKGKKKRKKTIRKKI